MEITADVPIAAMLALGGIALLVLCLDRRRARLADRGHKAVIAGSMGELNDMVTHVMLGVRDLDTYESDETVPERLTQYLARNHRRAELLAGAIELHGAMCTTLSGREKKDIETTARFARWLLDNYCELEKYLHVEACRGQTPALGASAPARQNAKPAKPRRAGGVSLDGAPARGGGGAGLALPTPRRRSGGAEGMGMMRRRAAAARASAPRPCP